MLFNSAAFLLFFPIVTALFFILPHRFRWAILLAASCFFYMFFKPEYILILAITIVVDYIAGIYLEDTTDKKQKKWYLIASLIANIGVLAVFKYYNFINGNITGIASYFGFENPIPALKMILPIGLSFHTFQAMSYTIEVYRGNQKAERHFGIYSLYVMFYPQLVAGPIERPQNILHQFHEKKIFDFDNAVWGMNMIMYGLFKKVVVADRLSVYVNEVYQDIEHANSISTLLAVFFFSIQIYCDFSGYSDIARGTAKFMGYDLMINFNRPYLAKSISEFWSRWHISLSTWFKDYLYIPLGGNRVVKWKWYRNLFLVFLISGLWHGANWTFIVWGALHGIYNVVGIWTADAQSAFFKFLRIDRFPLLLKWLNRSIVFVLVSFAWIFFRAESLSHAQAIIAKLFAQEYPLHLNAICADRGPLNLGLSFFVIGILGISYLLPTQLKLRNSVAFLALTIFVIILLGKNVAAEFIYFQF